jgi:hypothetical protein
LSAIRVHRIPPHVRDDRETPLLVRRDESIYSCFYLAVKLISEIQKLKRGRVCSESSRRIRTRARAIRPSRQQISAITAPGLRQGDFGSGLAVTKRLDSIYPTG